MFKKIFTISQLTKRIKYLIEENFPFIWINGEISNLKIPFSGHVYFTLKDDHTQIKAVIFRGQKINLKFQPKDGMSINGLGRLTVYEPNGSYQIILEYIEPAGIGNLQIAFEELKKRLHGEGLFHEKHKKQLPDIPDQISIITSLTGAVVHDIIKIINRRFPTNIEIVPSRVQGQGAVEEIIKSIEIINEKNIAHVIIIARGGGSIEDLCIFNTEEVARAIFASKIPIISAIGHETDYTIADFTADIRAPTPSAAAEIVVPNKKDLIKKFSMLNKSLKTAFLKNISHWRNYLYSLSIKLDSPEKRLFTQRQSLDNITNRLVLAFTKNCKCHRDHLIRQYYRLNLFNPLEKVEKLQKQLELKYSTLVHLIKAQITEKRSRLDELAGRLNALSPLGVLHRGYSITRSLENKKLIKDARDVSINEKVEVLLSKGVIECKVIDHK